MRIKRRAFLIGLASAISAPAIVRAEFLMPVRAVLAQTSKWHHVFAMEGRTFIDGIETSKFGSLSAVLDGAKDFIKTSDYVEFWTDGTFRADLMVRSVSYPQCLILPHEQRDRQ